MNIEKKIFNKYIQTRPSFISLSAEQLRRHRHTNTVHNTVLKLILHITNSPKSAIKPGKFIHMKIPYFKTLVLCSFPGRTPVRVSGHVVACTSA